MGGSISKMMGKIFGSKEMRLLMLGLLLTLLIGGGLKGVVKK